MGSANVFENAKEYFVYYVINSIMQKNTLISDWIRIWPKEIRLHIFRHFGQLQKLAIFCNSTRRHQLKILEKFVKFQQL